ncbi:hypothetical protein QBC38DRAFT_511111 [Podospora fimiseda]|uniref:Uncharacterized protein n=1 Tax=Podospora fimiseda TaxID=252190 RepID=A0AAN7GRQ0_9PEZI|nr:hypothetical protein QBC38DRAFT_511111 [Podospora fimiseda]
MASRSSSDEKKPKRQPKQQVYESEGEESDYAPPPRRRGQRQQKGGQGPLDSLALDNVGQTAGGLVNSATGVLGGVAGQAVDQKGGGGGKSDTLRLRLDLNLDIEITLKAKIHGDLELALLLGSRFHPCPMTSLHIPSRIIPHAFVHAPPAPPPLRFCNHHQPHDEISQDGGDIEIEELPDETETQPQPQTQNLPERKKTPAYVAPIPKIGSIPKISSSGIALSPERPKLPPFVGSFLVGKTVDESGDIVDERTGQVLARAGGDLPEIVGRKVSNREGDIFGDNGELLGYVADIEIERKASTSPQSPRVGQQQPRSLFDLMGRNNASLMVDHLGNILNANGEIVGKFHDNNNPLHRKEKEDEAVREKIQQMAAAGPSSTRKHSTKGVTEEKEPSPPPKSAKRQSQSQTHSPPQPPPQPQTQSAEETQPWPRRTEDERRQNAEAWRKENPGESPSDIFLDVKSTTEGIQLTIRIPTVFGGQHLKPNISFS